MSLKSPAKALRPDFTLENEYSGLVCGLDEVGRGPAAGPVVAGCVYMPEDVRNLSLTAEIQDSKKLSYKKLEELYEFITEYCVWAVAEKSPQEIDEINILQASLQAMAEALNKTGLEYTHALVDGNKLPVLPCSASAIKKGDSKSVSIAAASIVAKVTRDRYMRKLHEHYPHYGWDTNVGYPSKAHKAGIDAHGITEHHRKSFAPVKNFILYGSTREPLKTAV